VFSPSLCFLLRPDVGLFPVLCGSRFLGFPFRRNYEIELNSVEHCSGRNGTFIYPPAELDSVPSERSGIPFRYSVQIAPEFTSVHVFRYPLPTGTSHLSRMVATGTLPEHANAMAMVIQND
jgi:hypothetical protein